MGEKTVEDQEIAGLHGYGVDFEAFNIRLESIAPLGLTLLPFVKGAEELGNTLKAAGFAVYVDQGEHALDVYWEWLKSGVDVGVDEASEGAATLVRSVEVGTVDGDPELLVVPDVYKCIVEALLLAIVPEGLVIVDLYHAAVVQLRHGVIAELRGVPCGHIFGIHLLELPEELLERFDIGSGDGLFDHYESIGLPVLEVSLGKDAERLLFLDLVKRSAENRRCEFIVAGLAHYFSI
jgi:hypothetical protein